MSERIHLDRFLTLSKRVKILEEKFDKYRNDFISDVLDYQTALNEEFNRLDNKIAELEANLIKIDIIQDLMLDVNIEMEEEIDQLKEVKK